MRKMNTLLAITASGQAAFRAAVKGFSDFFRSKQGAFQGEKGTYEAAADTVVDESKRKSTLVISTVDEKFNWFKNHNAEHLNEVFTVEKGNANNITADLVVGGKSWGTLTTLELLRLKGILEDNDLLSMMSNIPVRSDKDEWNETTADQYKGRSGIFESPLSAGESKTTVKESYILADPNIGKLKEGANYVPQLGIKNTVQVLGSYTHQKFSGEWSQRQRAELLQKRNTLYKAVIQALKEANDVEVVHESKLGTQVLEYLF